MKFDHFLQLPFDSRCFYMLSAVVATHLGGEVVVTPEMIEDLIGSGMEVHRAFDTNNMVIKVVPNPV